MRQSMWGSFLLPLWRSAGSSFGRGSHKVGINPSGMVRSGSRGDALGIPARGRAVPGWKHTCQEPSGHVPACPSRQRQGGTFQHCGSSGPPSLPASIPGTRHTWGGDRFSLPSGFAGSPRLLPHCGILQPAGTAAGKGCVSHKKIRNQGTVEPPPAHAGFTRR